jgi:NAD(P)-dependent dehydrogenase (short-subunit alcohol dehydrogenase family)
VTDGATIDAAVETVRERSGSTRFAGIVNNAGVARGGPLEHLDIDIWREQLEINVIGQIAVTKAFLPLVREGGGRIVFIGSISGRVGTALMGPYGASKFALAGVTESLRHELHPFGIEVVLIEPGVVRTKIWDKGTETADRLEAEASPEMLAQYQPQIDKLRSSITANNQGGVDVSVPAKVIERALFHPHPRPRYLVGPDAKAVAVMARLAPDRLKDLLVRRFG